MFRSILGGITGGSALAVLLLLVGETNGTRWDWRDRTEAHQPQVDSQAPAPELETTLDSAGVAPGRWVGDGTGPERTAEGTEPAAVLTDQRASPAGQTEPAPIEPSIAVAPAPSSALAPDEAAVSADAPGAGGRLATKPALPQLGLAQVYTVPKSFNSPRIAESEPGIGEPTLSSEDGTAAPDLTVALQSPAFDSVEVADLVSDPSADPSGPAIEADKPSDGTAQPTPDDAEDAAGGDPELAVSDAAPDFDIVRVSAEGEAVIAGRAEPNAKVEVLLDDAVVSSVRADTQGSFVVLVSLGTSAKARALRLRSVLPQRAADSTKAAADAGSLSDGTSPEADDTPNTAEAAGLEDEALAAVKAGDAPSGGLPSGEDGAAQAKAGDLLDGEPANVAALLSIAAPDVPDLSPGQAEAPSDVSQARATAPEAFGPATQTNGGSLPAEGRLVPRPRPPTWRDAGRQGDAPGVIDNPADLAAAADLPASGAAEKDVVVLARANALDAVSPDDLGGFEAAPEPQRYALSAPVVILPTEVEGQAPLLVKSEADEIALLQAPQASAGLPGLLLQRITYDDGGDVVAIGEAADGHAIRVYSNGKLAAETAVGEEGRWEAEIPVALARQSLLLRIDEVDATGSVIMRVETPFTYASDRPDLLVQEREIEVVRGDNLWTFAEQFYGDGIRFSVIFEANARLIRDPDLIYPGQVFSVPELVATE